MQPQDFVDQVLRRGLGARYVLVGDDFTFGARRAGTYATLDSAGAKAGFDVARMMSYEVHGARVSSSAVRAALAAGDMTHAAALLGRPYCVSGRVQHGRKLGRELGFRTLNLRFGHARPAAMGIFVVRVFGLGDAPLPGVASLGRRPTVDHSGRVLLETHVLDWPDALGAEGGYGRLIRVELLAKLHDERHYASMAELRAAIATDTTQARAWFAAHGASR
jgi:riboflavin kinase/FMN adenylyltransferase